MHAKRLIALCVFASSCGVQFSPETLVDSLRILSISAEPPEVAPGEPTTLKVLFGDPKRLGQPNTVIWVGCEPDPEDLNRSACNDASLLIKPSLITEYPPGLRILGFDAQNTSYASSPDVFSVLAPDDVVRQNGSVGQVMAIVIAEEVKLTTMGEELNAMFRRIENKETSAAIGLTRVVVSEKAQKNHNPVISALTFDGAPLPQGARLPLRGGQQLTLGVEVPASSLEQYIEQQPSGPVEKTETVVGAWYSSGGRFSRERFDVTSSDTTTYFAPGSAEFPEDPVPERRTGQLWLVVRDNRGAQTFERFFFYVCDESLPTPEATAIVPPASESDTVLVTGSNMSRVLDVIIGGMALTSSSYSSASEGFIGFPPSLPAGTYPVTLRGQNCSTVNTGLFYTVP